jgi:hypothetical protein
MLKHKNSLIAKLLVTSPSQFLNSLLAEYKNKTVFQKTKVLLDFINSKFESNNTAQKHVSDLRARMELVKTPIADGGFGDTIKVDDLGAGILLNTLTPHSAFDNFVEAASQKSADLGDFDTLAKDFEAARAAKPGPISIKDNPPHAPKNNRARHSKRFKASDERVQEALNLYATNPARQQDSKHKKYSSPRRSKNCTMQVNASSAKRLDTHRRPAPSPAAENTALIHGVDLAVTLNLAHPA